MKTLKEQQQQKTPFIMSRVQYINLTNFMVIWWNKLQQIKGDLIKAKQLK